ncbi:MoaD/ThiS family protein [Sphingosinicella terrae]|jgi:sulfur-carrier protein|uniref:MoaD/ThiS family protein n=1 Tax=Sphingosinicella terrae TaxID=2172047 RepID=UPI000E0DF2A9|nr:MoaD/ThiS family protein [Sphingosinicella terrae]
MAALEILYYGRFRDAIGRDREEVDLPSHVLTVDDLIAWLRGRGDPHSSALREAEAVRAAVAGEWAERSDSVFGAVEVALFPPVGVF